MFLGFFVPHILIPHTRRPRAPRPGEKKGG